MSVLGAFNTILCPPFFDIFAYVPGQGSSFQRHPMPSQNCQRRLGHWAEGDLSTPSYVFGLLGGIISSSRTFHFQHYPMSSEASRDRGAAEPALRLSTPSYVFQRYLSAHRVRRRPPFNTILCLLEEALLFTRSAVEAVFQHHPMSSEPRSCYS